MNDAQKRLALELDLLEIEAFAASLPTPATSSARGLTVKSAPVGSDYDIEGLGAPFGGPFNGRDLTGEYFSKSTDFCLDFYPQGWPLCFEHGMDRDVGTTVVGRVKAWKSTPEGLWVQAQLDRSNKYWKAIQQLVDQGKLFFSSGSMPHMVEKKKSTGEITQWPICEMTLTSRPANPLAVLSPAQAQKRFAAAGLRVPQLSREDLARELDLIEAEAFAAGLGCAA